MTSATTVDIMSNGRLEFTLSGTLAEIRAQVQRYVDVGITHWIMAMGAPFDLDALQLFADEVMAAFR